MVRSGFLASLRGRDTGGSYCGTFQTLTNGRLAMSVLLSSARHHRLLGGGGCWFAFDSHVRTPQCEWQSMEALMSGN